MKKTINLIAKKRDEDELYDMPLFQEAEHTILKKIGKYPKKWPWLMTTEEKLEETLQKLKISNIKKEKFDINKLPTEIIILIFNLSNEKLQMFIAFPWLKDMKFKCNCCDNSADYIVKLYINDVCRLCKVNYHTRETFLCKLDCENLYFSLDKKSPLDKQNLDKINVEYSTKDCCYYCHKSIFYSMNGKALQIDNNHYIKPKKRNKKRNKNKNKDNNKDKIIL